MKPKTEIKEATIWRHRHILDLDDFTKDELELIFSTTDGMKDILLREIKMVPALRGKRIVTLFYEPSTRTRSSFELAAKSLSADVISITASTSSIAKGESLIDTIKTLESLGADAIIIRHPSAGAPYLAAQYSKKSIINAGDGWHAHPTQALLDLYTIKEAKGRIEGLKIVIVGDIIHSRVARSNIWGLSLMGNQVVLCGPPTLLPPSFLRAYPWVKGETVLENALEGADVVMPLRIQWERHQGGFIPSLREYIQLYQINKQRLSLCKPDVIILHPGPVNEGVEISQELSYSPHSLIQAQVRNGVAVRMALLYLLCGGQR